MPMNVNEGLSYAFAVSRQCLRIVGVWPDPQISLANFRQANLRLLIVTCVIGLYVLMPQMMNMIRAWGNVALMVEHVGSVNYSLIALMKLFVTRYRYETLRTLMTSVMTDWTATKTDRERKTMLTMAKHGRSLSYKCYIIVTTAIMFYMFFNVLKIYHHLQQSEIQRRLVYHYVYPYNVQKSPNYEITVLIQLSGGVSASIVNFSIDSFISMLLLHVCAQLINLRLALNDLVDELANGVISSSRYKEGLAAITRRHEHLITNAKTIDNCYSGVLFAHMGAATFQLCFQTFQVYTKITDKNADTSVFRLAFLMFYVLLVLSLLYFYCYSAERLITESTSIAYGVYKCKWYDIPSKEAKDLMFIVHRSMIPLRLTAGKFATFSMEMFGIMVKTSIGYLSVLLTMRG